MVITAGRIEVEQLSKSFRGLTAVSDLSFTAEPGRVTGFLGPNGSGKTTTLSMLLGLIRPESGIATIGGISYSKLEHPARVVGSALSASFHPAHTGRAHLDIVRRAIGAPAAIVDEKLQLVGLADAADRKTGGYSLGMRQRLALAAALLGDPQVLVLDEPINGLDPEGIRWIRIFLKHFAGEGKTVLLSSHLLSEVQHTVDDVVIIREGQLAFAGALTDLRDEEETVLVSTPDNQSLASVLQATGANVQGTRGVLMRVTGLDADSVGRAALDAGIALSHLSVEKSELEGRFLELIDGAGRKVSPDGAPGEYPAERRAASASSRGGAR